MVSPVRSLVVAEYFCIFCVVAVVVAFVVDLLRRNENMDDNDADELLETIIISFVNDDKWRVMFGANSSARLGLYLWGVQKYWTKKSSDDFSVIKILTSTRAA